jgi:hypothetical protein
LKTGAIDVFALAGMSGLMEADERQRPWRVSNLFGH